jgi:TRAP-type C4-dicarboxylate transport system permease small subunit
MSASGGTPRQTVVLQKERHLKWRSLDVVERALMWLSGLLLAAFTVTVFLDVLTRTTGTPILWLQEVTLGAFVWGVFIGGAAAVRRNEHFLLARIARSLGGGRRLVLETISHLILLAVAIFLAVYGFAFALLGLGLYSQPSGTPLALTTAAIPVSGVLIALFTIERLVNGWRGGFESDEDNLYETYAEEGGAGE